MLKYIGDNVVEPIVKLEELQVEMSVLVLNASYEAINVCNLRRAMKMVFKGTAQTEEVSDIEINSPSAAIKSTACHPFSKICSRSAECRQIFTKERPRPRSVYMSILL